MGPSFKNSRSFPFAIEDAVDGERSSSRYFKGDQREGATLLIYRGTFPGTNVIIRRWAQTNGTDCPRSVRMASYMQAACSLTVKQSGNLILELNISTVIPHPSPK